MSNLTTKQCSKCKEPFPRTIEYFHKDKRTKDGLKSECKNCHRENMKRRRESNPEYGKLYYQRNKNELSLKQKDYYVNNRAVIAGRVKSYRENNLEKTRALSRQWRKENPEKVREYGRQRRILEANAEGSHSTEELKALFRMQDGLCFHCGVNLELDYHEDHWIPLSRGGTDYIENIRLLCQSCNQSKYNKLPHEWCPEKYLPE